MAKTNLSYSYSSEDRENMKFRELINSAISDYSFSIENFKNNFNDDFYFDKKLIPYLKSKLFQRTEEYEMQFKELKESEKLYLDYKEVPEKIYYDLAMSSYYTDKFNEELSIVIKLLICMKNYVIQIIIIMNLLFIIKMKKIVGIFHILIILKEIY